MSKIDGIDRQIVAATQNGLPLVPRPYDEIGQKLGLDGREVRMRMQRMLDAGIVRRMGAVPNHYALGLSTSHTDMPFADNPRA